MSIIRIDFQIFGGLFGFLNIKSLYLFKTALELDYGHIFIIYALINLIGRILNTYIVTLFNHFHNLRFNSLHFIIGLFYLIFALPRDKVELMESSPLSEVWYPALLSTRMTTLVATQLSIQDPAKAKARLMRVQSHIYLRSIVLKMGVEYHRSQSAPTAGTVINRL